MGRQRQVVIFACAVLCCSFYILLTAPDLPAVAQIPSYFHAPSFLRPNAAFSQITLSKSQLQAFVGPSPRFLAKDTESSYGYNNIRYFGDITLNLASILDRIPILPDRIYARDCAVAKEICSQYAQHIPDRNRHAEFGGKWNEDGDVWKLHISEFLDLPHLRKSFGAVVTMEEFFTLYDMDLSRIPPSGHWESAVNVPPGLVEATFPNAHFETKPQIRVDRIPNEWKDLVEANKRLPHEVKNSLNNIFAGRQTMGLDELKNKIQFDKKLDAHQELIKMGIIPLYTFSQDLTMCKPVTGETTEYAPIHNIHGLIEDQTSEYLTSDILHFPGNLHDQRKPGSLRFTTAEARDRFSRMILDSVRPPARIREMGELLAEKMARKLKGKPWAAVHVRRGDFLGIGWNSNEDDYWHKLEQLRTRAGERLPGRKPERDDSFYLATDEQSPEQLQKYRERGAILLSDIMTDEDKRRFGWQANFVDLLSMVEQQILARADVFVGSKMSSTTGGAINVRLVLGKERWSWDVV